MRKKNKNQVHCSHCESVNVEYLGRVYPSARAARRWKCLDCEWYFSTSGDSF